MPTVRPLSDIVPTTAIDAAIAALEAALPRNLRDDRFSLTWQAAVREGRLIGALASRRPEAAGSDVVGFAGGIVDPERASVALDCLTIDRSILSSLLGTAIEDAGRHGLHRIEFWFKPADDTDGLVLADLGAVPYRTLHQMRCALPLDAPSLPTRPFRPGLDDEALVGVNNRAFAHHPVQGTLTLAELRAEMTEPWFDADGIRLHEIDGVLAGFCWTKRHDQPRLGEVYVICVDPAFHGKGLGRPMTAAGLSWLAAKGETTGMLYVEADNVAAIKTYERLGFEIVRTDRAWLLVQPDADR